MNSVTSKQITEQASHVLSIKAGSQYQLTFNEVLPAEFSKSTSLVFVPDLLQFQLAQKQQARGLIIKDTLWPEVQKTLSADLVIWTTPQIYLAMSQVLKLFDLKLPYLKVGIHPTSVIHPTAQIHPSAHIGAHCVVDAFATVGAETILYPHVYIGAFCVVGDRCLIAPHSTLGADGFSFYSDMNNTHHKIPQIGRVVIEDDCEIGAQCAIDRAALTETRLRKGTKLDNFCHIAHNVEIGENSLITAGFIVAGSTKIGRNFTTAGGVHVGGHINIADNVTASGRAGISNNVKEPGVYGGFPLEPHRESIKTLVSLPHIKILRKQVNRILKHLNMNSEEK